MHRICRKFARVPLTREEWLLIRDIAAQHHISIAALMRLGALSAGLTDSTALKRLLKGRPRDVPGIRCSVNWSAKILEALANGPLTEQQLLDRCHDPQGRSSNIRRAIRNLLSSRQIRFTSRRSSLLERAGGPPWPVPHR